MTFVRTVEWSFAVFLAFLAISIAAGLSNNSVAIVDLMWTCVWWALAPWGLTILATGRSLERVFATMWILALPIAGLLGAIVGSGIDLR